MIDPIDVAARAVINSMCERPVIAKAQIQITRARFWIMVVRYLGYTVLAMLLAFAVVHYMHLRNHQDHNPINTQGETDELPRVGSL